MSHQSADSVSVVRNDHRDRSTGRLDISHFDVMRDGKVLLTLQVTPDDIAVFPVECRYTHTLRRGEVSVSLYELPAQNDGTSQETS